MRLSFRLLTIICLFLRAVVCSSSALANSDVGLRTVTLQLDWKHQFQFAGYYAAVEKGFFKDAGLNVNLVEAGEGSDPSSVFDGRADFGTNSSDILLLRSKYPNAVIIASVFQHSPSILLVLEKSEIKYAHDLKGKRVAISLASCAIQSFLAYEGITPDKYQLVPQKYEIGQLINGEADAYSAYSTDEPFELQEAGIAYRILSPLMDGIDFYGDVLFTTSELVTREPDLVKNFRQASLEGWKYALNHPDEIIDLIYNKYSKKHSINYMKYEAQQMKDLIIHDVIEIGYSNPERWQRILGMLQEQNIVPKSQKFEGLLYEDYSRKGQPIPWKIILPMLLVILLISLVSYFFYYTSRNLRLEISRRKKIQNELAESEEHYRSIIKASPDSIIITDMEGSIRLVSPSAQRMFGYDQQDLLGRPLSSFLAEQDRMKAKGRISQMKIGNYAGVQEFLGIHSDGGVFPMEVTGEVIRSEDGASNGFVFVTRNISERKKVEDKILKTNRFYEFISQINQAIVLIGEKEKLLSEVCRIAVETGKFKMSWIGFIDEVNSVILPLVFAGEESGYLSIMKRISVSEVPEGRGPTGSAIREGKHFICDDIENDSCMVVWRDDAIARGYRSSIAIPIKQSGKVTGVFSLYATLPYFFDPEEIELLDEVTGNLSFALDAIEASQQVKELNANLELKIAQRTRQLEDSNKILLKEIEERKRAEEKAQKASIEAEQANIAKSEFLSRMSHELRTPMNSILGFAQLLEIGELNSGQKKGVSHIKKSGKHLLDLINEVLDISRIEAGRISLSLEPVQVCEVIQEMIEIVRQPALERNIQLDVDEASDKSLYLKADKQRLKQILLNLLNNGIKYNKPGGTVSLEARAMPIKSNGVAFVRISVKDSGLGISAHDIPKLFNPFERIGAEKTETEGTGLGLSVVKKLTNAMGGEVGVESVPGDGSTFWVEFPLCGGHNLVAREKPQSADLIEGIKTNSGLILYIEDNASNVALVEEIISSQCSNIRLITNAFGSETVKLAVEYQPNLILLDLNLPDIHGSEVLKLLQANQKTSAIPVVVISADAMPQQIAHLMQMGANRYITKPLDLNILLSVIDELIA